MKTLAFAVVLSFGVGFAVGVTVYDAKADSCERAKENAERFAAALAEVLNGGWIETNDVAAKCRIKRKEA